MWGRPLQETVSASSESQGPPLARGTGAFPPCVDKARAWQSPGGGKEEQQGLCFFLFFVVFFVFFVFVFFVFSVFVVFLFFFLFFFVFFLFFFVFGRTSRSITCGIVVLINSSGGGF